MCYPTFLVYIHPEETNISKDALEQWCTEHGAGFENCANKHLMPCYQLVKKMINSGKSSKFTLIESDPHEESNILVGVSLQ